MLTECFVFDTAHCYLKYKKMGELVNGQSIRNETLALKNCVISYYLDVIRG